MPSPFLLKSQSINTAITAPGKPTTLPQTGLYSIESITMKKIKHIHKRVWVLGSLVLSVLLLCCSSTDQATPLEAGKAAPPPVPWTGPAASQIPIYSHPQGKLIWYGYELIANTAYYLGPKGKVLQTSNGMNCQNCHLDAGTKPFGNNYGAVASTYPKFRERSGTMESIEKRVNDCFERSMNCKALDTAGREMQAIVAYIQWLGHKVPKGEKPYGSGIMELPYLTRAADPVRGQTVFVNHCARCHGNDGQGTATLDGVGYEFPPLWGPHSYNDGAGLYRLSRFAGYVYNNMPNTINWHHPELSVEQAWDVAAFVNTQPRPKKDLSQDWPNMAGKPVDHPFGPYADTFDEKQHKYGPFGPIVAARKK
jgi:thiosulfate dehydrogenase